VNTITNANKHHSDPDHTCALARWRRNERCRKLADQG